MDVVKNNSNAVVDAGPSNDQFREESSSEKHPSNDGQPNQPDETSHEPIAQQKSLIVDDQTKEQASPETPKPKKESSSSSGFSFFRAIADTFTGPGEKKDSKEEPLEKHPSNEQPNQPDETPHEPVIARQKSRAADDDLAKTSGDQESLKTPQTKKESSPTSGFSFFRAIADTFTGPGENKDSKEETAEKHPSNDEQQKQPDEKSQEPLILARQKSSVIAAADDNTMAEGNGEPNAPEPPQTAKKESSPSKGFSFFKAIADTFTGPDESKDTREESPEKHPLNDEQSSQLDEAPHEPVAQQDSRVADDQTKEEESPEPPQAKQESSASSGFNFFKTIADTFTGPDNSKDSKKETAENLSPEKSETQGDPTLLRKSSVTADDIQSEANNGSIHESNMSEAKKSSSPGFGFFKLIADTITGPVSKDATKEEPAKDGKESVESSQEAIVDDQKRSVDDDKTKRDIDEESKQKPVTANDESPSGLNFFKRFTRTPSMIFKTVADSITRPNPDESKEELSMKESISRQQSLSVGNELHEPLSGKVSSSLSIKTKRESTHETSGQKVETFEGMKNSNESSQETLVRQNSTTSAQILTEREQGQSEPNQQLTKQHDPPQRQQSRLESVPEAEKQQSNRVMTEAVVHKRVSHQNSSKSAVSRLKSTGSSTGSLENGPILIPMSNDLAKPDMENVQVAEQKSNEHSGHKLINSEESESKNNQAKTGKMNDAPEVLQNIAFVADSFNNALKNTFSSVVDHSQEAFHNVVQHSQDAIHNIADHSQEAFQTVKRQTEKLGPHSEGLEMTAAAGADSSVAGSNTESKGEENSDGPAVAAHDPIHEVFVDMPTRIHRTVTAKMSLALVESQTFFQHAAESVAHQAEFITRPVTAEADAIFGPGTEEKQLSNNIHYHQPTKTEMIDFEQDEDDEQMQRQTHSVKKRRATKYKIRHVFCPQSKTFKKLFQKK